MFKKASEIQVVHRLRMALDGPAGSGKTWTSLLLAQRIAEVRGGRVALIDTEHGSALKYQSNFDFDWAALDGDYHPDRFVEAIRAATQAGYAVLIIDSLTHAWSGPGGVLDLVDRYAKVTRSGKTDKFSAWADVTPIHNRLIESILSAQLDIIATMRTKTEYANENGKIHKLGTAPIQRDGVEYEFDIIGDMNLQNEMAITKSRCPDLAGKVIARPGPRVADTLLAWLGGTSARVEWADQFFADAIALGYESSDAVKARLKELGHNGLKREKVAEMLAALKPEPAANDNGHVEVPPVPVGQSQPANGHSAQDAWKAWATGAGYARDLGLEVQPLDGATPPAEVIAACQALASRIKSHVRRLRKDAANRGLELEALPAAKAPMGAWVEYGIEVMQVLKEAEETAEEPF